VSDVRALDPQVAALSLAGGRGSPAERLRAAAVPIHYVEEPTLPHGFWKFAPLADAARAAATRGRSVPGATGRGGSYPRLGGPTVLGP
jgi:hypothetical protein